MLAEYYGKMKLIMERSHLDDGHQPVIEASWQRKRFILYN